jgi:hypothetical protein
MADFVAASVSFWKDVDDGGEPYNCNEFRTRLGRLITIKDPLRVFVFESGSPDYLRLIKCCFAQRATFFVPDVPANDPNQLGKASVYILGDNE